MKIFGLTLFVVLIVVRSSPVLAQTDPEALALPSEEGSTAEKNPELPPAIPEDLLDAMDFSDEIVIPGADLESLPALIDPPAAEPLQPPEQSAPIQDQDPQLNETIRETHKQEVPNGPLNASEADPASKEAIAYKAPSYGSVLPEKVLRIVVNNTTAHADGGFDSAGKNLKPGLELNVQANIYALQYGLTDRITVIAGFAHYNIFNLSVNDTIARSTELYRSAMEQQKAKVKSSAVSSARQGVAEALAAQGKCPSTAVCMEAIESGLVNALPVDLTRMGYKAGSSLQAALDAYGDSVASVYESDIDQGIRSAFESKAGGAPGASDLETGLAYSIIKKADLHVSTAASLRLPTGRYKNVPGGLPTPGAGKTTLALIGLADYQLVPSIWVSATWKIEQDLSQSAAREGTVVRNKFNDHSENLYLSFAPGALTPWLKAILFTVSENFQERSSMSIESTVEGIRTKTSYPAASQVSRVVTKEIDLTQYKLPLMFTHSTWIPIRGRNVSFAARKEEVNAIVYWKF